MKKEDIQKKVFEIIADKLAVDEKQITLSSDFIKDLKCDSLDTVELIMEFERELNVSIPDDKWENITTVQQAIDAIDEKLNPSR